MKLIAATALAVLLAWPAAAQQCIADGAGLIRTLRDERGQKIRVTGITHSGVMMVITVSPDKGAWTLMGPMPSGVACVLDSGVGFAAEAAGEDM